MAKAGAVTLVVCIAVGSIGLKTIAGWLSPAPVEKPRPIVFDNGSVRDLPASEPAAPLKPKVVQSPPGRLRKCLQPDGGVVYSNLNCPPGAKEAAVRSDGVNVVSSGLPKTPPAGGTRPLQPGETLQQRALERAIEGATGGPGGR